MRQLKQPKRGNRGFTLVELMVVVALIGLVMTQGVPWLESVSGNARRTSMVNSFVAHLNSARNFAITGDDHPDLPCVTGAGGACDVSMCKSLDLATCDVAITTTWDDGWIMFWDADADQVFDVGTTERLIRVHEAVVGNATLAGNTNVADYIRFDTSGMLGSGQGTFIYCDSRGFGVDARAIIVSGVGRVRVLPANDPNVGPTSCTP